MVRAKESSDIAGQAARVLQAHTRESFTESQLTEAIEALLAMEKIARLGNEVEVTGEICVGIIKRCYQAKDFKRLNDNISLLAKRRGQHKNVVKQLVDEAISYLPSLSGSDLEAGIATLRAVTEGKMYVEVERARLTKQLAAIKENAGNLDEAAELLQEVHVETYGTMEKREKAEFLLEQVRITLKKKDLVRTELLASKLTGKILDEELFQDIRLAYYNLMVQFHGMLGDRDLDIARSHHAIYNTPVVLADAPRWQHELKSAVAHAVMAPYGKDQVQLIATLSADKRLKDLPEWFTLVSFFTREEISRWPEVNATAGVLLRGTFPELFGEGQRGMKLFQASIIQHNIIIAAKYYSRISTARLSALLDLSLDEAETFLSELVVEGKVFARVDRPSGIVNFRQTKTATDVLNSWSADVNKILGLVERGCHLVNIEAQRKKAAMAMATD